MITSTFTTSVGDITITIDDGGTSTSVEVEKLGQLKYEFDQTPDSVQIDRTIALYSYIQVVYQEQTSESEDLYDRLIANLTSSNADVTLSIDNFGADTFDFSFELKQENVDFNQKDGSVTVRFTPKIDETVTISNVIQSVTNYDYTPVDIDGANIANISCLPVVDYLDNAMKSVFGNTYEAYIQPSKNSSNASFFKSNSDWSLSSSGFIVADPNDIQISINSDNLGDPQDLNITSNIVADNDYYWVSFDEFNNTQTVGRNLRYKVQATNILDQFPGNTAIGWFADEEVTQPLRIDFGQSTQDEIVTEQLTFQTTEAFTGILPPNTEDQILTSVATYRYGVPFNDFANASLKDLAGFEGSIYGTGFSRNFYVHRLSDNDSEYITLNYDLVSSIKQKKYSKFLFSGIVRQISDYNNTGIDQFGIIPTDNNARIPNLSARGSFIRGNPNANKSLEINQAPIYPYLNKAKKLSTYYVDSTDALLETSITSAGVRAYMQSLNQQGGGLKIELTYLSALVLKPYELFQFDSTAPEKYQNKQFRITSVAYDFVKDETKIVGYQINSLATPVVALPPPGVDVPVPPPDTEPDTSTLVSYIPGWNMISNPTTSNALGFGTQFGGDEVNRSSFTFTNGTYTPATLMQSPAYGNGYWVYLKDEVFNGDDSKQYEYSGNVYSSNVYGLSVDQGWNLVPSLGVSTILSSNTATISNGTTYGFDGVYFLTNYLQPGKGYWTYVDQSGTIDLLNQGTPIAPANLQEDFKRIDIVGNNNTLAVFFDGTNSNTNINIAEQFYPPAIANNFDVRINQDETNTAVRDLRAVESNTINIDVQQIDAGTTLNIVPKIGVAASSYYQCTFLDGDKIITAQNVGENTAVDVPITTSRIQVQPMGASIKLPVRAKDIANDDGELLDSVPIAGATGAIADRIQYMNDSGYLTELITTGTADFIQAVVSRPEFSSKQNNVPSKSQVFLFSYDGTGGLTDNYISGFSGGSDGKVIRVINVGSNSIVLSANDTGSTAGNRILGSNVTLGQYEGATLIYIEDFTGTLPTTTIDGWIIVGRNN